jgi:1-acyl-sn-glycerol-3-phosphate acyltransferase
MDEALPQWLINVLRVFARSFSDRLWHINYIGLERVPREGGLIIAANHQTYIDPFWIGFPIKRIMRFLAWDEAFNWPVTGKLIRFLGAWPLQVDRSDPTAIRRSLHWLRCGGALMIFPEGGRGLPTGETIEFKTGAARLALEANVPILPVTIRGAHQVWPHTRRLPRFRAPVDIIYHPPRYLMQLPGEDTRTCARRETNRLAQTIQSALSFK